MEKKKEKMDFDSILTEEEKATETYLGWPNETIGLCVRQFSQQMLDKDITGFESIKWMAAVYALVGVANSVNAGELKQTITGVSIKGKDIGDWEIIVRQKKSKKVKQFNPKSK